MKESPYWTKEFALEASLVDWGVVNSHNPLSFTSFQEWLKKKNHGPLLYMDGERGEKRKDLKSIFPQYQSALICLFSYASIKKFMEEEKLPSRVAGYALGFNGEDYHYVLKKYLETILCSIKKSHPQIEGMIAIDTLPILERDFAYQAGLGWFGKNSMLISRQHGSFVMLGSILLSEVILPEMQKVIESDHCGQCTRCIDACPTLAIDERARTIIASKCISTFTIEMFKEVPAPLGMENAQGEIFGCDICQDVCPWNKKVLNKMTLDELQKKNFREKLKSIFNFFFNDDLNVTKVSLLALSNRAFRELFKATPLARTGRLGLLKNVEFWLKHASDKSSDKGRR